MPKAEILKPSDLDADSPPDLNSYTYVLVAEGDSWLSLGSIPAHNLLQQLDFGVRTAVINLAYPGDTMQQMRAALGRVGGRRLDIWAGELGRFVADRGSYPLTAMLLSGGGNDLIDAVPHLLKKNFDFTAVDPLQPEGALDDDALALFDRFVVDSFTGIVDYVRASPGPNHSVPVFCHTYDYPTPNDAPATVFGQRVGEAWLHPHLLQAGVPTVLWQPLADHLLRHLAGLLRGLRLPDFHAVPTLDTLVRAAPDSRGASGDWDNEIHPNASGYRKLAHKIVAAVKTELGLP